MAGELAQQARAERQQHYSFASYNATHSANRNGARLVRGCELPIAAKDVRDSLMLPAPLRHGRQHKGPREHNAAGACSAARMQRAHGLRLRGSMPATPIVPPAPQLGYSTRCLSV